MFPSVKHMITPKRTKAEITKHVRHTVKCWRAVPRQPINRWRDDHLYDSRISDKDLRARARALVEHCLEEPVTEDA